MKFSKGLVTKFLALFIMVGLTLTIFACGTTTVPPTTQAPTTQVPTTQAPTTLAPTTLAPTTLAPTTQAPTTQPPTTVTTETPLPIDVESISVMAEAGSTTITEFQGTLQVIAVVLPQDAEDKTVVWTVENGTGSATISSNGLVQAVSNGTVTVRATSVSNPQVSGTLVITITNQEVLVASISVTGTGSATTITTFQGTLQMIATVLPENAENKAVVWTVENGTGEATISSTGLLTAVADGTVTVKATSVSTPTVFGSIVITISNQEVLVASISVTSEGGSSVITEFEGTLQMIATVLPENAHDKTVIWTVENGTGEAIISSTGLLTAVANGTVIVKATSVSTPTVFGTKEITISNQEVLVESIFVTGVDSVTTITTFQGTLQMVATVLPENADDKTVIWTVINISGEATISSTGLLTAIADGEVMVKATSVSTPEVFGTQPIMISNQEVLVTSINVTSEGDLSEITEFHGTLQMIATVLPENAEDKTVIWTVENGTGEATISSTGLLTAVASGTVTVKATSVSTPEIYGTMVITLSNQEVLVESITVSGEGDVDVIVVTHGTLQMLALVLPENAEDKTVVWTVENGTGMATISPTGLLTAVADGTVIVTATSVSTPEVYGTKVITISNQAVVEPIANVDLGLAGDFVILTKSGISTTGTTLITGNIGVSPSAATYITGFDLILDSSTQYATSSLVVGKIYASDYSEPTPSYLTTAISNMEAAYTDAAGRAANYTELYAGDISGRTLYTGVYKYSTDLLINTDVVLSGSPTDVFIFQVSGKLALANGISIILDGGVLPSNIVWVVAGTVSIGTNASFVGTVLAQTDITVATNATVVGRLYAQTEVTLDANIVGSGEIVDPEPIAVESITVSGTGDVEVIDTFEGTLQMIATVLPVDADDDSVVWSVVNGTGEATISETGLLTAVANGTVTVIATSVSTPTISGELVIMISNQEVLVTSITVSGTGDVEIIDTPEGTLQMIATVLPFDADDDSVVWSVVNGTGAATISETGLLTAVANGTVTVIATSVSTPSVSGELVITISNQVVMETLAVNLGTADTFTILAKTGISTTAGTYITGDIGVSPIGSTAITGFALIMDAGGEYSTSSLVDGKVYASDYASPTPTYMTDVILDMEAAYTDAASRAPDYSELYTGNLSGQNLAPGVYNWTTAVSIDGTLTLTGSATDVWIFQISGALTQAAAIEIILAGGALPQNVFWQVAGSVTIGADAIFQGTILCASGIAVGNGATVIGKLFAQTAVTLDANIVKPE